MKIKAIKEIDSYRFTIAIEDRGRCLRVTEMLFALDLQMAECFDYHNMIVDLLLGDLALDIKKANGVSVDGFCDRQKCIDEFFNKADVDRVFAVVSAAYDGSLKTGEY